MFYIVPSIIYKTIENSSASKEKFITLIKILVKKKLFHGSARSLHRAPNQNIVQNHFNIALLNVL